MNTQIVEFNNQNLEVINHNNQNYLTLSQIASALEYNNSSSVNDILSRNQSEFDEEMTCLIKHGRTRIRIFNREGAWLIGMFARTPKAAEFRRWVLKVLGNTVDKAEIASAMPGNDTLVEVREHKRSLPSGKKEIVLSAKAKEEIGGITKAVVVKTLDEKLPQYLGSSDKLPDKVISEAFHQTADEIQAKKAKERKEYYLSSSEAEIIEKIRSANAFNMLNLFMGVSNKLSA